MNISNPTKLRVSRKLAVVAFVAGVLSTTAGVMGARSSLPHPRLPDPRPAIAARTLDAKEAGAYLRDAARAGDSDLIAALTRAGTPVDDADEKGYTSLILAAYHGNLDSVERLLEAGADACRGDKRGNTALMGAAFKGYEDVVARLSREPCTITQQNGSGRTAYMFAAIVGRTKILRLLESRGADPNARDRGGMSANDWAKTQGTDLRGP